MRFLMRYAVVFEKVPRNLCAHIPDLPGRVSTGDTFAEIQANIREARRHEGGRRQAAPSLDARWRRRDVGAVRSVNQTLPNS